MKLLDLEQIEARLPSVDLITEIEAGFVAYSESRAVVPPVGELVMEDPPGEVHIKYGYLRGDDSYVIKVASGFYDNPSLGLPSSNGLMLVFNLQTGALRAVLLDEGRLTDVRTAVAGAVAAKHLAPSAVTRIGILGTGIQARLQLRHLAAVTPCRDVVVWGRGEQQLRDYSDEMSAAGYRINTTQDAHEVLRQCNLVVTTTPATEPILTWSDDLDHGVQITAVGADASHKCELDRRILERADVVVADSREQCLSRGEIHHAVAHNVIAEEDIVELGDVIAGSAPGRTSDDQVTVADLTGVAVQDIQIAKAIIGQE